MASLKFSNEAVSKFNELLQNAQGYGKLKNQHEKVLKGDQSDFFLEILRVYENHVGNSKKTVSREMCEYCIHQITKGEPIDIERFMTSVRTEKNEQKQAEKIAMIKESIDKINSKSSNYSMQITVGMLNKPYKLGGLGFYKEVALESWLEMKAEIEIFYKNHFAEKMTTFEKARENNQKALKKLKDAKIK